MDLTEPLAEEESVGSSLCDESASWTASSDCTMTDTSGTAPGAASGTAPGTADSWIDITKQFMATSSQLELGVLLHDSNFGLFEAMSAIEMMDPKMDAGMVCNQVQRDVYTLDSAVEKGVLKLDDLSFSETVAIVDETWACLVTWLEGHSLAQTVFTNLYLHNPNLIDDCTLKAFCIAMLKIVDHVRDRINRASVFEEEDFQPMNYGFRLAPDVTDVRVFGMLKEAEEEINRRIKNAKAESETDAEGLKEQQKQAAALVSRVHFTRLFLGILVALAKEKSQGVVEAQRLINQSTCHLTVMTNTVALGVQPVEDGTTNPRVMGFEPLVNQRLLPPTFPRYTKICSRDSTMTYIKALLSRIKELIHVIPVTDLHATINFFHNFSESGPCVLSRSLLQLLVLPQLVYGNTRMLDVLKDTMKTYDMPLILCNKNLQQSRSQTKDYVETFLWRAIRAISSILQITGHNRARQRDKWATLLTDMASLQEEADKVDSFFHNALAGAERDRPHRAFFGTWILYHTLNSMIRFVLAGLELELYAVHEYHYIFWYLYECLYSWLITTLSQAESFILEHEQSQESKGGRAANKKNKKKKRSRPHAKEITHAQAMHELCGGYYKAILGLTLDGKLQQPTYEFDKEEVRYNHRFAPFGSLATPPPVQYKQFKEMTDKSQYDPPLTADQHYEMSLKYFHQAKTIFENILKPNEEIQALIKICRTNHVVVSLLRSGHRKNSQIPPEFNFTLHPVFPTLKLA